MSKHKLPNFLAFETSIINESKQTVFYRVVGGGQFGGAPITYKNQPQIGAPVSNVFATPHTDAVSAMIEYCLDQGEDEMTGKPIKITDMRVLKIETSSYREPHDHEKFMHWDESDQDEAFILSGKIISVEAASDYYE